MNTLNLRLPPWVSGLRCVDCGWSTADPWAWSCPACGPESRMDVVYEADAPRRMAAGLAGRPFDQWRYRELLPLPEGCPLPGLLVGGSPLVRAPRLAAALGVAELTLKDDGRNPSASLKDRPSAVAVALALASGASRVACASTGNAASSLACMAASAGLPATIFVPRRAPAPKIAQLRAFGATVLRVDADYDRTWELCAAVVEAVGRAGGEPWFNRNCAVNPYLVEGKKTVALELAEQLGPRAPDWVSLSVGDGCTVAGVVKGLEEAFAAGLIPRVPRVLAVQAAGAAPLVRAAREGGPPRQEAADTLADSIAVGVPRNPKKALDAVARNHGAWIAVTDEEILTAIAEGAALSGVFAEPAAAAATAGVRAAVRDGLIAPSAHVAVIVSGNGLKDPSAALRAVSGPQDIPADLDAALRVVRGLA